VSVPFILDKLSLSMEEGQVLAWLVADGDEVAEGQDIAEIETDKATEVVAAPAGGVIRILVAEGEVVPVETLLAEIGAGSRDPAAGGDGPPPSSATPPAAPPPPAEGAISPPAPAASGDGAAGLRADGSPFASPAARAAAAAAGLSLEALRGTGPGGRVIVADVLAAAAAAPATAAPRAPGIAGDDLRAAVVASVSASWSQVPHIHIGGELEADGLATAHRRLRAAGGPRVTATDLLIVAVVRALQDVGELNGVNVGGGPRRSPDVHLGLAVATEASGVVAPVLRDAAELSVVQVARERARLVDAARSGDLERSALAGATCTLSNLGASPVDFFAPVISGPQIALIAVGRAREVPVARDGLLGVGVRMWVNAAIDHRAADGEAGGRFLAALQRRLADLPALA